MCSASRLVWSQIVPPPIFCTATSKGGEDGLDTQRRRGRSGQTEIPDLFSFFAGSLSLCRYARRTSTGPLLNAAILFTSRDWWHIGFPFCVQIRFLLFNCFFVPLRFNRSLSLNAGNSPFCMAKRHGEQKDNGFSGSSRKAGLSWPEGSPTTLPIDSERRIGPYHILRLFLRRMERREKGR